MFNKIFEIKDKRLENFFLPWPEVLTEKIGAIYAIFGEDTYQKKKILEAFQTSLAFTNNPALNIEKFSAQETIPSRILESAYTLPFLGARRLIIIYDFDQYKTEQINEFLPYLAKPVQTTCLVITGSKLNSQLSITKTLKKTERLYILKKLYPQQIVSWIMKLAKRRSKKLPIEIATYLSTFSHLGLEILESEIEKIFLYIGNQENITMKDVHAIINQSKFYTVFDLTNALTMGKLDEALFAYFQLDALGEPPLRILAMILRLYRQLLTVREILNQGGDEKKVLSTLRIPIYVAKNIITLAKIQNNTSIEKIFESILIAELELKSSTKLNKIILEHLIMKLCQKIDNYF